MSNKEVTNLQGATEEKILKRGDFFETRTITTAFIYSVLDSVSFKLLGTMKTSEKLTSKKAIAEALADNSFPVNAKVLHTDSDTKLYGIKTAEEYYSVAVEIPTEQED